MKRHTGRHLLSATEEPNELTLDSVLLFFSPHVTELRTDIIEKNHRGESLSFMRLPTERPLGAYRTSLKGQLSSQTERAACSTEGFQQMDERAGSETENHQTQSD